MKKQIQCPSCGGNQDVHNPGINMLVCQFCSSTLYWDKDAALFAGEKSILPEADTRLYDGATGKLDGKRFEVVGHVRYAHDSGHWDEWYIESGGKMLWLSEDERKLTLETVHQGDEIAVPKVDDLYPGQRLRVAGDSYTVREFGQARCVGGWGQLPFAIVPDETYPYADLANESGDQFATLEYDREGAPHVFTGEPLAHERIEVDKTDAQFIKESSEQTHADKINCASCAAPLEPPKDRDVQTLTCDYCGAQNDLSTAEAQVLGMNPKNNTPNFDFEIGQTATFRDAKYEVCGRQKTEDDEGYPSLLYLLWHPKRGYLYLEDDGEGEFSLLEATQSAPSVDPFNLDEGDSLQVGARRYNFVESGEITVKYVDGAFPWQVGVGDRSEYADAEKGSHSFSAERGRKEIEYFVGQTLSRESVLSAFGLEHSAGAAGTPINKPSIWQRIGSFFLTIIFINVLFVVLAMGGLAQEDGEKQFTLGGVLFSEMAFVTAFGVFLCALFLIYYRNSLRLGLFFLLSLILIWLAPAGLLMGLSGALLVQILSNKKPDWLFFGFFAFLCSLFMVSLPETLELRVQSAVSDAVQAMKHSEKRLAATRKTWNTSQELTPWVEQAIPEAKYWGKDLSEAQSMLDTLKKQYPESTLKAQTHGHSTNILAAHPLSEPLSKIQSQTKAIKERSQQIQTQLKVVLEFEKNVPKQLQRYRAYYQRSQWLSLERLEAAYQQAQKDWQRPQAQKALQHAWQRVQNQKPSSTAQLRAQIEALWKDNQPLYQQAKNGEIDADIYQKLPKLMQDMQNKVKQLEQPHKLFLNTLKQLYTHWERLLVDMEIVESSNDVSFYQTFRTVNAVLPYWGMAGTVDKYDRRESVMQSQYNRLEPFMGMAIEQKPAGYLNNEKQTLPVPAGYSMITQAGTSEQNPLGSWQGENWVWAAAFAGLGTIFWNKFYNANMRDERGYQQEKKQRRSFLGRQRNAPLFGNKGSFSQAMYADSAYYRNKMYKNTRYISSGRTWIGYVGGSDGYRSGSSSGSRSSYGK